MQVTATLVLPLENQGLLEQQAGYPEMMEEKAHRLAATFGRMVDAGFTAVSVTRFEAGVKCR